jgi:hypothetical protein
VVITNTIRHNSKESDCLPESLASHPGGQLPQLAGEVNHDGNHQQRERAAHQCAERTQLNPGKAERPQCDRAEPDVGQPDRQHRGDREAEGLRRCDARKPAGGEREPQYKQRHDEQRSRPSARLTERGAGLMQQIQRERRGDQQQCQHAQPDHVAEIGIAVGEFGQHHRPRYHRADAADHRCRALDQRTRADAPG